jgi:hypothetical protein
MTDDLLWQEIFSLREKLKIAVEAIKFYCPDFDDKEFVHCLNNVEYAQMMEEFAECTQNTEQGVQADPAGSQDSLT